MKVLLAVTMTMLIGSSAFAACAVGTSNECNDKASCEGLSDAVKKYTFVANAPAGTPKCQSLDGPVTTNCTENKDGGRSSKETAPGKAEAGAAGVISK
jgi:hypothetical protein